MDDVNHGFLNSTFNNQVRIKLDECKNLEIPAVACNGMPSSCVVKVDQSS